MKNFYGISLSLALVATLCNQEKAGAQSYYKDIISTRQINETFHAYAVNKVKTVKLATFNGSTPITEGFFCEQKASYRPNKLVTYTKTSDEGENYLTAVYNADGQVIKSTDSTSQTVSMTTYQYNEAGQLTQIRNESKASDNSSLALEVHNWSYNATGKPVQMLRIRNTVDTILVKFTQDEKGNTGEEESFRKNVSQGKFYYYFDDKNRLTDVVRYNVQAKRLMPDFLFEYEDNGDLSSMTLAAQSGAKYQKWYYKYDDKGLKLADFCYDLKEQLQGKVEYDYGF